MLHCEQAEQDIITCLERGQFETQIFYGRETSVRRDLYSIETQRTGLRGILSCRGCSFLKAGK